MRTLITAIIVGWSVYPPGLQAQSDWTAVQKLVAGTGIRVEADSRRATGILHSATDSEIVVANSFGDLAHFDRQDVQRILEVFGRPDAKKRGAIIGFAVGAGWAALATIGSAERDDDRRRRELPLVWAILAGGGAAIGAWMADEVRTVVVYRR
jgi:hypothetical protein